MISIPLKPDIHAINSVFHDEKKGHRYSQALRDVVDGPRHVTPLQLFKDNISSNAGLMSILLKMEVYRVKGKLLVTVADCNIYMRIMKALWSKSFYILSSRSFILPVLGWWHSFKFANILIWRKFKYILQPLFKLLYPGQEYKAKPKYLTQILYVFSVIRHAASKDYVNILSIFDESVVTKDSDVCPSCFVESKYSYAREHIRSLRTLIQLYIPVLQDYGLYLKLDDFSNLFNLIRSS
ncbi:hypothetical protein AAMO2058_001245200 [Amorphochlora amoebiformis]|eukprot:184570-Amorphochlora_amoeboformis.AAC.1